MANRRPWHGSAPRIIGGALLAAALVAAPTEAHAHPDQVDGERAAPAAKTSLQVRQQLEPLAADEAWRYATGAGVTVAVLDSGVDADHPDLDGRVLSGRDYVDGSTDGRTDPVGHGTTVASLVAGRGDETVGLAPDARILPVRVLDDDNRYQSASTVADGVAWAVEQGAQVINLSLGGDRHSRSLHEALDLAMANDVVVVACTGNATGDDEEEAQVWYPAREPGVVAVSGLAWPDGPGQPPAGWPESLTGPETVLAAPAVVTGAEAGGGHRSARGTSFSSALVAATAALIRERWPQMPAGEVVNRLIATAEDLGETGRDPVYGYGLVDPVAALTDVVPPVPVNPLDTRPREGTAGLGSAVERPVEDLTSAEPEPTPATAGRADLLPSQPDGGAADEVEPAAAGNSAASGLAWAVRLGVVLLLAVLVPLFMAARVRRRDRCRPRS